MIPLQKHPDEERDPLQVYRRSLPDDEKYDEQQSEEVEARGMIASVAVACSVIVTVVVGAIIGLIILFNNYRHLIGL